MACHQNPKKECPRIALYNVFSIIHNARIRNFCFTQFWFMNQECYLYLSKYTEWDMTPGAPTILLNALYQIVVSHVCITRSKRLVKSFPSFALCEALLTSVEEAANLFVPE